jgi:hypothetical protein
MLRTKFRMPISFGKDPEPATTLNLASSTPIAIEEIPPSPPMNPAGTEDFPAPDLSSELSGTKGDEALHRYVKTTDYWFNMELGQLENYARGEAQLHAQAGLPRPGRAYRCGDSV